MKIKYKAPILDRSGLGEASRRIYQVMLSCGAFEAIGVEHIDISPSPAYIIPKAENPPEISSITDYDTVFIFCPPYQFHKFVEKDKKSIGYTMWETDKIEQIFIDNINLLDLLIVPSCINANAFINHHPNVKILPIPHRGLIDSKEKYEKYTFYSIMEWTDRKSPMEILTAYFLEFHKYNDVNLILKVGYKPNMDSQISKLIEGMRLDSYPNYQIVGEPWNEDQILSLHQKAHCYISLSKGEGWNLPLMDAVFAGNQIISTENGFVEHLNDYTKYNQILGLKEPLLGMMYFPYVNASHNWIVPSINDARKKMKLSYKMYKFNSEDNDSSPFELQKLYTSFSVDNIANTLKQII